METEERKDLLNRIYYKLLGDRTIANKTDLANAIKMNRSSVSLALKGDSRYLTDGLFSRIYDKFGNVLADEEIQRNVVEDSDDPQTIVRYWTSSSATAGGRELYEDTQTDEYENLVLPGFQDCTDAVNLFGDSMSPLFNSGEIIILRPWTDNWIDYGQIYLIITTSGYRMVKYVRAGNDADHVICVSENKQYDDIVLPKSDILKMYLVKGAIHRRAM